jgi:hypothetical protein
VVENPGWDFVLLAESEEAAAIDEVSGFLAGGSWTSSLDRVPQVSDAIRCRDDIRVVQF